MYEKLVESLRNCVADENGCCFQCPEDCNGPCQENLMTEAADAIEEMNRRIGRAIELYNRNVEKSAVYEALIGISPEPPKEER